MSGTGAAPMNHAGFMTEPEAGEGESPPPVNIAQGPILTEGDSDEDDVVSSPHVREGIFPWGHSAV